MIKTLLKSKKFIAALVGLAVVTGAHFGFALDQAAIMTVVSPILIYILGQGVADIGKEKAKIDAASARDERLGQ